MLATLWTSAEPNTPLPDVAALHARERRRERISYLAEALAALWAISFTISRAIHTPRPALIVLAVAITIFMVTHAAWEWHGRLANARALREHTRGFIEALRAIATQRHRSASWTRRNMPAVLICCLIWAGWLIDDMSAHYRANPAEAIGGLAGILLISAGTWWWTGRKQREHAAEIARYDALLATLDDAPRSDDDTRATRDDEARSGD